MTEDKRLVRVPILLTKEEAEELDEWQHVNRLRSRSEAIREMMRRTYRANPAPPDVAAPAKPKRGTKQ